MADNKKYYYLRLKDNFFESDEMIVLESMENGYIYSNILLKLYLKSLKNEGKLMFNERIPFNSTMLATITRHSEGVIEKAIGQFKDLGLIDVLDNGAIYMLDIQNYIGKTSTEADRKKEYRERINAEKKNLSLQGQMSGQMSTDESDACPENERQMVRHSSDERTPEIEIEQKQELEIDLEREKELYLDDVVVKQEQKQDLEKEQDTELKPNTEKETHRATHSFNACCSLYEKNFHKLTAIDKNSLSRLEGVSGTDFLYIAIEKTIYKEDVANPLGYITKLIQDWLSNGFTSIDDIKDEQQAFNAQYE